LILLVLVALLWMAVLAPSAWRRFGERQGVGSIDHFHHQLQLLEHAGPKTVAPAYRLHTSGAAAAAAAAAAAGTAATAATAATGEAPNATDAGDSSRPKLVLLRPTEDADAADLDDEDGAHYQRVGVLDRPEPVCLPETHADLPALRRDQARYRCTILLRCLCAVAVSTALIGVFPKLHLAWIVTGLSGIAALGLVGLMAYARELEAEQERRRARRAPRRVESSDPEPAGAAATTAGAVGAEGAGRRATAGYPGAWDDMGFDDEDFDLPQVATR